MANDDIEWTSEQMIENANNWSLAGDVAILNRLKKFSETFLTDTETLNTKVDDLLNSLEYVSLKLDLTKNEFQSLKNTQFIENRVYEDDETLESDIEKTKEKKEPSEEDKEDIIRRSIAKGLEVMKKYYDKVEVAVSDSEGESNDKSYILQPKDPYIDRPLPYLVGTAEWYKKWHVGLLPSDSESESEKEEEAYSSSSDSEKYLPKNRVLGSETSSELDFINRNTGPVANSTFNDSQDSRREVFHSSDDSSEQSSSLPVKIPISNEKFAEQLAAKLGDVIRNETSENVSRASGKIVQTQKYGNLFASEPPPLDDSEDTLLPKSAEQGLFSGGPDLFAENSADDLFWDSGRGNSGRAEVSRYRQHPPSNQSKPKTSKGLFDDTDSSSEEDMLTVTEKRKMMSSKIANPYMQPYNTTLPFIDDQPPEITPKVERGASKKKPIGGVAVFGKDNDIFAAESIITEQKGDKVSMTPPRTQKDSKNEGATKKVAKKISLFDESSDEEIFVPKTRPEKLPSDANKKLSLFEDSDEFPTGETSSETKKDDNKEPETPQKLFDDDTDQNFSTEKTKDAISEPKKISLFDDDGDDDFLKEEEDIFSAMPKKKSLFDDLEDKPPNKITRGGLFDDLEGADDLNINKISSSDDVEKAKVVKKPKSLFEESEGLDIDDLFIPRVSRTSKETLSDEEKPSEIKEEDQVEKDGDFKPKAIDTQQISFAQAMKTTEDPKSEYLSEIKKNMDLFGRESDHSQGEPEKDLPPHEDLVKDGVSSAPELKPTMPPPINLFDPTPPPVDWDASSDNSVESDRFSLTDGILDRTNYNQSQPTASSLFDEAPPSLDVNDMNYSSGIVRDINATRIENDDSSFYPHASSSRRLSSDIFNDQQSQDSFFVTKNPSENQTHASSLEKIPENAENVTSKIENLTPSGVAEDFDGSGSVFEEIDESVPVDEMDKTRAILDMKSVLQKVSLFGGPDVGDGGGKTPDMPPVRTSPGKLKNTLNINVGALLPGAAPPRTRPSVAKSTSLDETDEPFKITETPATTNRLIKQKSETLIPTQKAAGDATESGHFENISGTEVLHSVTKDRPRIQVKRRPSTRKARLEAVRKSLVDPGVDQSSEQPTVYEETPSGARADQKTAISPEASPEIKGISLVFDRSVQKTIKKMPKSHRVEADLFDDIRGAFVDDDKRTDSAPKKSETTSSSLFEDNQNDNLFKSTTTQYDDPDTSFNAVKPTRNPGLFGAASSEEDLFSSASKPSNRPAPKSNLFSDNSGSDSDSDLFGSKSKQAKQPGAVKKPTSIFDDSGDSGDEDLFGSNAKSAKAGSAGQIAGASQSFRRAETKSAVVKKLENKEVTDFDPLSGFK